MISTGHREEDIWEYPYPKFLRYLEAATRAKKASLVENFELSLIAFQGSEDSVKAFRKALKGE